MSVAAMLAEVPLVALLDLGAEPGPTLLILLRHRY